MCGITGWIDWERDLTQQKQVLAKMVATLVSRGPDDEGYWLSPRAAFGHRRLSVVDPAGGAQPMIRERDGRRYVLAYNGELYNTTELRNELIGKGYKFKSHSDTEVLLCSYMQWGPECLSKLNGIFAFGIWDESEQTLLLARDRLGVKPLFYAPLSHGLVFGSELKALLAHPEILPHITEEGLAEVLLMGPARTPGHGAFKAISELRSGNCLLYRRQGIKKEKYWSLVSKQHTEDLKTTADRVRELVVDSVERQLVSDVPVCTLLSGGLDSSAITAIAAAAFARDGRGPLHTYSVDYYENELYFQANEFQPNMDKPWIERVSDFLGTIHHTVNLSTTELAAALQEATRAKDLPGMADVDSSLYLFCKEVKKGATVALSGECADEVFGGYPWFFNEEMIKRPMFPWVSFLEERIGLWNPTLFRSFHPREYVEKRYLETLAEVPRLEGETATEARQREMFYLNMNWFMQTLLDRKDRMSMACGLEVRVPFADHRLVEYVWNIPWSMKMCDNRSKGILRRALQGLLPTDVLDRKKSPYPKTHHPAYTATVRGWLTEILSDTSAPLYQVINPQMLKTILAGSVDVFDRPFFGQLMRGPQLFAYLIQLNIWLKEYKVVLE